MSIWFVMYSDLTSVQSSRDICPHGRESLSSDDLLADRRLNGHLEQLPGYDLD